MSMDGTPILDDNGNKVSTYDNRDIQTFAKGWTGFHPQKDRSNVELPFSNLIDPMRINILWRDPFPKMDLHGGYIGDFYPLCKDLPKRFFLRQSAKYRLLGSHQQSELLPYSWVTPDTSVVQKRFELSKRSLLRMELCNANEDGECQFQPIVTLNSTLKCKGAECDIDTVNVVQVSSNPPIYYEFVQPPCVNLPFIHPSQLG